jgi:hypothetical protein
MTPELQATVEQAYKLFAGYTVGSTLSVCNCNVCMTKETERELASTPLRDISSRLLAEYTNSAHTWDDDQIAREMRHFLPRYLELIAFNDPPDNMGLDICLRRLQYAEWRTKWPREQVELLDRYFDALTRSSLLRLDLIRWKEGSSLAFDIADLMTMIVTAHADIERVLTVWDTAPDPSAAVHMAALRAGVLQEVRRTYFHSAYLEGNYDAAADRIGAFLMRPEVSRRIEAAFFLVDDPGLQKILSDALWA